MKTTLKRAVKQVLGRMGLEVHRLSRPSRPEEPHASGVFRDAQGTEFPLIDGYRQRVWRLDWETMLRERAQPTPETARRCGLAESGRDQVRRLNEFLRLWNVDLRGSRILEVGCFSGAACYALMEAGASHVGGLDVPAHFTNVLHPTATDVARQTAYLATLREAVRGEFESATPGLNAAAVGFFDCDVADFEASESYDLVVSWNTVEHLLDPERAWGGIARCLRPGGVCAHGHHPFFCESGGHFDTLDFPWGHVRLSSDDFRRYIRELRPKEVEIAEWRFFHTMGRSTLTDLRQHIETASLEVLDILASTDRKWDTLPTRVMEECRTNYPTITSTDLLASEVWILARRPS
jgi:SAM-dependent methyltransferase